MSRSSLWESMQYSISLQGNHLRGLSLLEQLMSHHTWRGTTWKGKGGSIRRNWTHLRARQITLSLQRSTGSRHSCSRDAWSSSGSSAQISTTKLIDRSWLILQTCDSTQSNISVLIFWCRFSKQQSSESSTPSAPKWTSAASSAASSANITKSTIPARWNC